MHLHPLHPEQPLASQKREQWQQRQTEDGEMIAVNPLEQMNPQPFKLIAPTLEVTASPASSR